ncbi:MAG: ATP-dependent zinc metalloprotease FtsH [Spirochaetales bacterium]|nr:ATP-dependent zinc metalloprotease FtsH [Spirochaetales bacterium]
MLIVIAIGVIISLAVNYFSDSSLRTTISYSSFKDNVQANNISSITVEGEKITGTFRTPPLSDTSAGVTTLGFTTYLPFYGDDELSNMLEENDVKVFTKPANRTSVLGVILNFLPLLLLVFIFYSFYKGSRNQGNSLFSVGQNKAKLYMKTDESKTFNDVAGVEGAKSELTEIVDYLKSSEKFHKMGAKTPKGVLLVGPPGTGKTLLARAVAGEANVPFYSITGSDFMELFVGVGASRVRNLFRDARKNSPSIIFIDELDSIGRHRGAGLGGGHDEREQTLNQLLSEMDGFEPNESTIVIAATNRPDILDPALLRPGRFDRRVSVDRPTMIDRVQILKIHARNKPFSESVNLQTVAKATPGFSGADLENLLNEAALTAARNKKTVIDQSDINEAHDKILLGLVRKSMVLTEEERKTVAFHEAGHAVLAAYLPNAEPIHKVTVIPRDRAMGVTQQLPEGDKYLYNREYLLDRIAVLLGGRVAEKLHMGTITSGAENDLQQATQLARKMVLDWGMSERLANISLGSEREHVFLGEDIATRRDFSEATAREIDQEIKSILDEAFERATTLLTEKNEAVLKVANGLLEKEELLGEDIDKLLGLEPKNGNKKA